MPCPSIIFTCRLLVGAVIDAPNATLCPVQCSKHCGFCTQLFRYAALNHLQLAHVCSLQVGNGALTMAEQRAHFALWALMKAPLLIGTDLRAAPSRVKAVLLAAEVVAVNQDDLGVAADLVWKQGPNEARIPNYNKS